MPLPDPNPSGGTSGQIGGCYLGRARQERNLTRLAARRWHDAKSQPNPSTRARKGQPKMGELWGLLTAVGFAR